MKLPLNAENLGWWKHSPQWQLSDCANYRRHGHTFAVDTGAAVWSSVTAAVST